MPRALSAAAREAVFAQEAGDAVFLILLEITGTGLPAPVRVVNNTQPVTHAGNVYAAAAFVVALPAEVSDRIPEARLRIDNVDQGIVEGVRLLTGPPTVTLSVVLAATPDTIEAGPFAFTLRSVEYDALEVSGVLMFEDILNESFPKDAFTPALFPALFRDV